MQQLELESESSSSRAMSDRNLASQSQHTCLQVRSKAFRRREQQIKSRVWFVRYRYVKHLISVALSTLNSRVHERFYVLYGLKLDELVGVDARKDLRVGARSEANVRHDVILNHVLVCAQSGE